MFQSSWTIVQGFTGSANDQEGFFNEMTDTDLNSIADDNGELWIASQRMIDNDTLTQSVPHI